MSAKTMSCLAEENKEVGKQIGCMNGIFQIFDRHHFLTGRRFSNHSNKRLLQGGQHQLDQQYASKAIKEKCVEVQKDKPRISTESSRDSVSSTSCSSTFSSVDYNKTATKEHRPSSTKGMQSHDLRDIVKDSMYREVRSLSIKSQSNDESRGTVMKHIDSPRPSQQPKIGKPKSTCYIDSPRYSYDGRESREMYKSAMKHKELPRLSLDSKTGSMKALESRLSSLGRGPLVENDTYSQVAPLNRKSESHIKTPNIVAKLMGLNALSHTVSTEESVTPTIKSCAKVTEESKKNTANYSPRFSLNDPASPSQSGNLVKKLNGHSRFPVEPAPWRQQESNQGSPKNRKALRNTLHQTSSVFGEIEKRITELEFKKSGKDLRALKQILEAMQKTRERLEDRRGEPVVIIKPAKVTDEVKLSVSTRVPTAEQSHLQRIQTRSPKYKQGSSAHIRKANNCIPENDNVKYLNRRLPYTEKKTSWSTSEQPSPRSRQNLLRVEGQYRPTTPLGRVKKQCSKKVVEECSLNRRNKVRAKNQQLSDDQLSQISYETRCSSYQGDTASVKSETEIISIARPINTDTRQKEISESMNGEHLPAVESAVSMIEQPSPISVLDSSFYCEDTPSPVNKISTVFRDESPSLDEAEWHLENLDHLEDCTRSNNRRKYNHKLEDTRNSLHSITLLNNEPDGNVADHNGSLNPDHRYVNKILLTSGLLKDSSIISTTDQLISSHHLINPEIFHVLEQTEETGEALAVEKNDRMNLNNRVDRKIVFDMVDEILVRKITSGTVGKEQTSPQWLLKEVHLEMDRVCRTPDCNLSEQDEIRGLISGDLMYQSKDWVSYSSEVPALVLDIERLIFKDLINEVITCEVMDIRDWPKSHRRKLFSN